MGRWITFDHESLTAIATVTGLAPELHDANAGDGKDALDAALKSHREAVFLMPAADSQRVLVAHIRHVPAASKPAAQPEPTAQIPAEPERAPAYEAGGFLGLRDEPVYEDEPARPKKWWQKILD